MEKFENRPAMEAEMRRRKLRIDKKDIWSDDPPEFAGTWQYRNFPAKGKELVTPVDVDLIRKFAAQ